jgi:nitrate/TMAO reductase-like tetraheme cytochrome c subunit
MSEKTLKYLLFAFFVLLPAAVTAVTVPVTFKQSKTVEFCASCHVMTPFVEDMKNPESENLAALHYDNRWIAHDQCMTCHTDYVWFGGLKAKLRGMRHVAAYYLAPERREIELYEPFPNGNCLGCHSEAKGFRENPVHEAAAAELASGETSCLECHASIHPEPATAPEPEAAAAPERHAAGARGVPQ